MRFMHLREKLPLWKHKLRMLRPVKKQLLVAGVAVAMLVLLVLSEWTGHVQQPAQTESEPDYAQMLETKLSGMITAIDGAGKTQVLVTLKNGSEAIYARNDKLEQDSTQTRSEQAYVLVGSGSNETGLHLKTVTPQVLGVAVVCEGADRPAVRQAILDTVTAALDIMPSHVSVVRMQAERK